MGAVLIKDKGCATLVYQRRDGMWAVKYMWHIPNFEEWYQMGIVAYRSQELAFTFAEEVAFTLENMTIPMNSMIEHFSYTGRSFLWECRGWH